ncbi:hypothetical protein Rs2_50914 [Raphanus sativus]|nr:hypothetical protein Rs2_50914 [Raphanus sativus]
MVAYKDLVRCELKRGFDCLYVSGETYGRGRVRDRKPRRPLILQRPKDSPHKETIRSNLSKLLGADPSVVNLKAKTHEKVDSLGENRSIAAHYCYSPHEERRSRNPKEPLLRYRTGQSPIHLPTPFSFLITRLSDLWQEEALTLSWKRKGSFFPGSDNRWLIVSGSVIIVFTYMLKVSSLVITLVSVGRRGEEKKKAGLKFILFEKSLTTNQSRQEKQQGFLMAAMNSNVLTYCSYVISDANSAELNQRAGLVNSSVGFGQKKLTVPVIKAAQKSWW